MKEVLSFKKISTLVAIVSTMSVMATEFKFVHVLEQSYWYSRYNLGNLVMRSGNGQTFMPKMEMMKMMVNMVSDDLSQAKAPKNAALIKRIYNSGNPAFSRSSNRDMNDFSNYRWSDSIDTPTTLEAFGWTLLKEVEWSKQFNVDFHFGSPNAVKVPGAQQRFAGLVLCTEALVQAKELATNPLAFDSSDVGGQYVALSAVSDLSQYLATSSTAEMKNNRCAMVAKMMNKKPAAMVAATFLKLADKLYANAATPITVREKSLAIQALVWYAYANKSNNVKRAQVLIKIKKIGNSLTRIKSTNPVELSYLNRAMIEVYRMTKSSKYLKVVSRNYKAMIKNFNNKTGIFNSKTSYSTEDVATILGAMNAMKIFAGSRVNQAELESVYINFFNTILNKAKMQISAPPVQSIAQYERRADHLMHRSPELPMPPMAGYQNGIAPVFAAEVNFKNNAFTAQKDKFDTAGAMHLANEMIWVHHEQVNGFPEF